MSAPGEYAFKPVNLAIGCVLVAVVFVVGVTKARDESKGNQARDVKIKVARVEACRDVKDDALRAFCIVEGSR